MPLKRSCFVFAFWFSVLAVGLSALPLAKADGWEAGSIVIAEAEGEDRYFLARIYSSDEFPQRLLEVRLTDWNGKDVPYNIISTEAGPTLKISDDRFPAIMRLQEKHSLFKLADKGRGEVAGIRHHYVEIHPYLPYTVTVGETDQRALSLGLAELEKTIAALETPDDIWEQLTEMDGLELFAVQYKQWLGHSRPFFAIRFGDAHVPVFVRGLMSDPSSNSFLSAWQPGMKPSLLPSEDGMGLRVSEPHVLKKGLGEAVSITIQEGRSVFPVLRSDGRIEIAIDARDFDRDHRLRTAYPALEDQLELRVYDNGRAAIAYRHPRQPGRVRGPELELRGEVTSEGVFVGGEQLAQKGRELERVATMGGYASYAIEFHDGVALSEQSSDLVAVGSEVLRADKLVTSKVLDAGEKLLVLQFKGRRPSCCWLQTAGRPHLVKYRVRSHRGAELVYDEYAQVWDAVVFNKDGTVRDRIPVGFARLVPDLSEEFGHVDNAFELELDPRVSLEEDPETRELVIDVTGVERTEVWFEDGVEDAAGVFPAESRGEVWLRGFSDPALNLLYREMRSQLAALFKSLPRGERRAALREFRTVFWNVARLTHFSDEASRRTFIENRKDFITRALEAGKERAAFLAAIELAVATVTEKTGAVEGLKARAALTVILAYSALVAGFGANVPFVEGYINSWGELWDFLNPQLLISSGLLAGETLLEWVLYRLRAKKVRPAADGLESLPNPNESGWGLFPAGDKEMAERLSDILMSFVDCEGALGIIQPRIIEVRSPSDAYLHR